MAVREVIDGNKGRNRCQWVVVMMFRILLSLT